MQLEAVVFAFTVFTLGMYGFAVGETPGRGDAQVYGCGSLPWDVVEIIELVRKGLLESFVGRR
jgi:hypothetical protein